MTEPSHSWYNKEYAEVAEWYTRKSQKLVEIILREGSSPSLSTIK